MIPFVVVIICSVSYICSGCDLTLQSQYVTQRVDVTIPFNVELSSLPFVLSVVLNTNITIINIYGTVVDDSLSGVTFTGDLGAGNISFTVSNINTTRAGVYSLKKQVGETPPLQCQTVYVLGKPTALLSKIGTDPEEGDSITFLCSATSATVPTVSGMRYTWTFESTEPIGPRFTFAANRMTVNNITKVDQNKAVACKATEDVTGGLTSDTSTQGINVLFGPENVTFEPSGTNYIKASGESLPAIECKANCNPGCSYAWTKDGRKIDGQTGETLSLGSVTRTNAGTYTCTATRGSVSLGKNLTLNVKYGPTNTILTPPGYLHSAEENSRLTNITCSSLCWECNYLWTGPVILASGAVLSLDTLDRREDGVYTCKATNTRSLSTATTTVSIQVTYGPENITFTPPETSYTEALGYTLSDIRCEVECNPSCNYTWTKDRISAPVQAGPTLSLGILNVTDAGSYICTATRESKKLTKGLTVNVLYGPDSILLEPSTNNYTRNENDVLRTIVCSSECYPNCNFQWKKQSSNVPISNNGSLSLHTLTQEERGVYICTASNPRTSESTSSQITVNVRYGPDNITLMPAVINHSVVEGHVFPTVTCSADCWPGCKQIWKNVTFGTAIGSGGSLSLATTSRYVTGEYKCSSSNLSPDLTKSKDKSIYITVMYFPDVSVVQDTKSEVTEHDASLSLLCSARGEPDKYTFFNWEHIAPDLETPLQEYTGSASGNQSQLVLHNLSYMDSGLYKCSVTNNITDYITGRTYATNNVTVTVKGKPQIIHSIDQVNAAVQDSVSLDVTFFSNDDEEPTVKWYRINDTNLTEIINGTGDYMYQTSNVKVDVWFYTEEITQSGYFTKLMIKSVQSTDFANFLLRVNNSVGYNETQVVVSPKGPPEVPRLFELLPTSQTTSSITFSWYPGFHNGADQMFYIEYRKKGTSEWMSGTNVFGGKIDKKQQFNGTVTHLSPDAWYEFMIYATNEYGTSDNKTADGNTTAVRIEHVDATSLIGPVVGGAMGAVFIAAVIVGVVFVMRRRTQHKKNRRRGED